jgi:hypothetical protein
MQDDDRRPDQAARPSADAAPAPERLTAYRREALNVQQVRYMQALFGRQLPPRRRVPIAPDDGITS